MEGYLALIKEQREENDKLQHEIERLNNIINKFDKWLDEEIKEYRFYGEHDKADTLDIALYKLQELKGSDKK
jgi:predicted RNase H-like nuclease (RuvC/YqgF family)